MADRFQVSPEVIEPIVGKEKMQVFLKILGFLLGNSWLSLENLCAQSVYQCAKEETFWTCTSRDKNAVRIISNINIQTRAECRPRSFALRIQFLIVPFLLGNFPYLICSEGMLGFFNDSLS